MSYNHWFPGEPNNFGFEGEPENCISIGELGNTNPWAEHGGQIGEGGLPFVPGWMDRNCNTESQYICQKVVNNPITTTTSITPSTTPSTTSGKSIIISRLVLVKLVFPTFSRNAKINISPYEIFSCEILILAFLEKVGNTYLTRTRRDIYIFTKCVTVKIG